MSKLVCWVGATIGGGIGWWVGARVGVMTAFMVSTVMTGVGWYVAQRFFSHLLD